MPAYQFKKAPARLKRYQWGKGNPPPADKTPNSAAYRSKGMGSSLELLIYQALLAEGWRQDQIDIQTPILGGRSRRGGHVIDFVLYTPVAIPINVNGNYWHRNTDKELQADLDIEQRFGRFPVTIWGDKAKDLAQARAEVRRLIGRA